MASFPCIKQRKHTEKCTINSSQVHAKAHSVTAAGGGGGEAAPPARLDHINPANPNTFPFCLVLSIPPTRATFQRSQPDDMCVWVRHVCLSVCVCLCLSLARTRSKTFEAQHVALFHFVAYPFSARAQLRSCFQLVTVLASDPPPPLNPFTADCHGQTLSGLWSVFCGCCLHYVILVAGFSYSCYFSCCAWFSVLAAITLFSFCLATG